MKKFSKFYSVLTAFLLCCLGCTPTYKESVTMSDARNVQEGRMGYEHYFVEPGFRFDRGERIEIVKPEVRLKEGTLSRGESQYYSHHLQEQLLKMLSGLGFDAVMSDGAGDNSKLPALILETYIVYVEFGSDVSRRHHGLIGVLLAAPIVHIEGAFYEVQGDERRKVMTFYEEGGNKGGTIINNLGGQELVLASFEKLVNKNLKALIEKINFSTGYSKFPIKEMGLAQDVDVYNVLLAMGANVQGKGDTFKLTDKKIEWYAQFENKNLSQSLMDRHFRAIWYRPDGSPYQDKNFSTATGNTLIAHNALKIDPNRSKEFVGKWRVKVYEDNNLMDDRTFTIEDAAISDSREKAMEAAVLAEEGK
ncbi:MAG: hypothetical protein HYZ83_05270 [Candidatus Omnitrophica bacterium]|nr:hypothetical protein [Candidatus Omnitrophota bacterium]